MTYTTCAGALSNIGVQCAEKTVAGFTGRGLLGLKSSAVFTLDANGDLLSVTDTNMVLVDNVWQNALDGTAKQMTTDNGRPAWHTDLSVRVPRVATEAGAKAARDNEKALATNSLWGIFEREDGTYVAYGVNGKLIATAETQAENTAGGDWVNTLGTDESTPETLFVETPASGSDPAVPAKSKFNTMWNTIVNA